MQIQIKTNFGGRKVSRAGCVTSVPPHSGVALSLRCPGSAPVPSSIPNQGQPPGGVTLSSDPKDPTPLLGQHIPGEGEFPQGIGVALHWDKWVCARGAKEESEIPGEGRSRRPVWITEAFLELENSRGSGESCEHPQVTQLQPEVAPEGTEIRMS